MTQDVLDVNLGIAMPKQLHRMEVLGLARRLTQYLADATGLPVLPLDPENHRAITLDATYELGHGGYVGPPGAEYEAYLEWEQKYLREWVGSKIASELPALQVTGFYCLTFGAVTLNCTTMEPYCPVVLHAPRMDDSTVLGVQELLTRITSWQQRTADHPDQLAMLAEILTDTGTTTALKNRLGGGLVGDFLGHVSEACGRVQHDLSRLLRDNDQEPTFLDPDRRVIRQNVKTLAPSKSDSVQSTYRQMTRCLVEVSGLPVVPLGAAWREITLVAKHRTGWTCGKFSYQPFLRDFVKKLLPELGRKGVGSFHALMLDNLRLVPDDEELEFDVVLVVPVNQT